MNIKVNVNLFLVEATIAIYKYRNLAKMSKNKNISNNLDNWSQFITYYAEKNEFINVGPQFNMVQGTTLYYYSNNLLHYVIILESIWIPSRYNQFCEYFWKFIYIFFYKLTIFNIS